MPQLLAHVHAARAGLRSGLILASCALVVCGGGRVESHRFASTSPPPAHRVPTALKKNEQAFRLGLQALPEGLLVMGALGIGRGTLGLSKQQGEN